MRVAIYLLTDQGGAHTNFMQEASDAGTILWPLVNERGAMLSGFMPCMHGTYTLTDATCNCLQDERRLADECRLLAPLVGGVGKRGDKSRLTLAKIVRGIASGAVRRHCEDREDQLMVSIWGMWGM